MSGNCDSLEVETIEFPTKKDYEIIKDKDVPKYFI